MNIKICLPVLLFFLLFLKVDTIAQTFQYPKRFVFKKTMGYFQNGPDQHQSQLDSIAGTMGQDTVNFLNISETAYTEIHLNIANDTIWRHFEHNGRMLGDYFMLVKNSGILHYYDLSKTMNYHNTDLFASDYSYEIKVDKQDRKQLMGFDCFQLTITIKKPESDKGDTIYNMYVTDQLGLPLHALLETVVFLPNSFPLIVEITNSKIRGINEIYQLMNID